MPRTTVDLRGLKKAVNPTYYPLLWDEHRTLVLMGGAGSGKSVFCVQKILARIAMEKRHKICVLRKVSKTHRHSTWTEFQRTISQWGWSNYFSTNKTDMTFTFLPNGNQIIFSGLDDAEKLKSITGITSFWIEEATECVEDDLSQVDLRLRGFGTYKQIMLSFNPISAMHWLKARFFDQQERTVRTVRTTYRDNRFLDAPYVAMLEGLKTRDNGLWRIYSEGLWGVLKGLIYEPWPILEEWPESFHDKWYGLDFGFNHPMALVEVGERDGEYFPTELVYESKMTTADLAKRMAELDVSRTLPIYADSAEPDRIEELCRDGWNVKPANKGPGSVHAGIVFLRSKAIYTRHSNGNLNKEAATYKWAEDKDGRLMEAPVKFADHLIDGLRYAIYTHLNQPKFESSKDPLAGVGMF